jgi:Flp pilus assembly pilin Flp
MGVVSKRHFLMKTPKFQNLKKDRGASIVEFALVVTLVALMGFSSMSVVGQAVSDTFDQAAGDGLAGCSAQQGPGTPFECINAKNGFFNQ